MASLPHLAGLLLVSLGTLSCASSYRRCGEPEADAVATGALSATGLYRDLATGALGEGVVPFRPRFELWSDGATKRRWIRLPPGAAIDATDMDAWQFPVGTRLWKEFTRDGVRVETRMLEKIGPAPEAWRVGAYVWSADGRDAIATAVGAEDVRGTPHDVPPARHCMGCHGGTPSRVLGFSAVQLAGEDPRAPGELTLATLVRDGLLRGAPALPVPPLPGDARTRAALGYLHANCAHCHNQARPPEPATGRCYNPRRAIDLSLRVSELGRVHDTAVYRTALGRAVVPGDPEASALYTRARGDLRLFLARMPPLATEEVDPEVLGVLGAWIGGLPR